MALSSQPFADIGVADPRGEQAEGDGEHQDVHHGVYSVLRLNMSAPSIAKSRQGELRYINRLGLIAAPTCGGEMPSDA
jgi:hypothetical protein